MHQCQERRQEGKTSEKSEGKKVSRQRSRNLSSIEALIGDEEQKEKQERRKRKRQGTSPQLSYPGRFGRLLRPAWIMLISSNT